MTKRGSGDIAFFLVGGYDVLGTMTKFDDNAEALTEEVTVLGNTWRQHAYVGVRNAEITQEGFYDDAAGSVHDMLSTGPGVSRVLCYGVAGTATGAAFVGYSGAMQVHYERQVELEKLTKAKASYRTNGPVDNGKIVRTYKAAGATGASTGTPLDNAASSTGGAGYLQYNATAGEANIRIMDSADNITYSALFTFTKTASGFGAERLTTTGAIQRYTAADVTTATATGSIGALNYFVGIARGLTS